MKSMRPPTTRAEFERRFHLLAEQLKHGRLKMPSNMGGELLDVRLLPNGRIDFLSVNELARLQANMTAQFEDGGMLELMKQEHFKTDNRSK